MRTQLRIVGLSRMSKGRVCVSGYTPDNVCVRLDAFPSITESDLHLASGDTLRPFCVVDVSITSKANIIPPHTEDRKISLPSLNYVRQLSDSERHSLLLDLCSPSVADVFGVPVLHQPEAGYYVEVGTANCSLGIVRCSAIRYLDDDLHEDNKHRARIRFIDETDTEYKLTVNDLTWHYYLCMQRTQEANHKLTMSRLRDRLNSGEVFLRIGLAREYPQGSRRCNLQVTGIFSFPDYLEGKTWVDFQSACEATGNDSSGYDLSQIPF